MREFKFRAFHNSEEMIYFCLGNSVPDGEIMQYTGLKDKNGVESFKDDICDYFFWVQKSPDPNDLGITYKGKGVIVFEQGCFMIKPNDYQSPIPMHYANLEFEVIGNIHQNG